MIRLIFHNVWTRQSSSMARAKLTIPSWARARVAKKAAVLRDNTQDPLVASDVSGAKHHTRQHALTDKYYWWGSAPDI